MEHLPLGIKCPVHENSEEIKKMQQNCPDNMFRVAPMEVRTTVADFHEAGMTPVTKDLLTKAVPTSSG